MLPPRPPFWQQLCLACCVLTSLEVFQCFCPPAGLARVCLAHSMCGIPASGCVSCAACVPAGSLHLHIAWHYTAMTVLCLGAAACTHAALLDNSDVTCPSSALTSTSSWGTVACGHAEHLQHDCR